MIVCDIHGMKQEGLSPFSSSKGHLNGSLCPYIYPIVRVVVPPSVIAQ